MLKALLIAEKPSLKRTIEEYYKKHKSEIPYDIDFIEQRGHLVTLMLPDEIDEEQKKWCWENLPFHPEEHGGWRYKTISEKKEGSFLTAGERYKKIGELLKRGDYDFVINAGDPDQEGELLIRSVLKCLGNKLPVKRFWTNAITESAVIAALKNLMDDDSEPQLTNLLQAGYGRQHSDYRFGMNISRAMSLKMGGRVPCGRVMTPILGIVCKRENEISNFTPKTVYGVKVHYKDGFTGQLYEEKGSDTDENDENSGYVWFDGKEDAFDAMKAVKGPLTITTYDVKRQETFAPKLFKLATLQIAANNVGLSTKRNDEALQSLYEKGYVTYPRTSCEYLSSSEELSRMIESARTVKELGPFIDSISPSAIDRVKATKKYVNDAALKESGHSAIVPTTEKA